MNNFTFYSPTCFVFGKDTESQAGALVRRFGGSRILIHYGGGSAVRSGLLTELRYHWSRKVSSFIIQLGGVKPNPRSGLVYEGIKLCRKKNIDFILPEGAEASSIPERPAAGTVYDGDFWDFYSGKRIEHALPVGTVLTIAAAGSEGSPDSVITREDGMFKRGASGDAIRPRFSILNPALTQSLPAYQTAAGIVRN